MIINKLAFKKVRRGFNESVFVPALAMEAK
jgi:hypothetical protein